MRQEVEEELLDAKQRLADMNLAAESESAKQLQQADARIRQLEQETQQAWGTAAEMVRNVLVLAVHC